MTEKPETASGYLPEQVRLVKETALYVATMLGDLMDEVVVVGGLVPSLIIGQTALPVGADPHAGTMDVDLGLAPALFDEDKYKTLAERLRGAGFLPDRTSEGRATSQRWKIEVKGREKATIDFLIPPSRAEDQGGRLRNLLTDFAAMLTPGLDLAFRDRQRVRLAGRTIRGEEAEREIWVCGPGAFVVLKALAFRGRGENKDAYDLCYVLRNYESGPASVADHLAPFMDKSDTIQALTILSEDFLKESGVGPKRVAKFITGREDHAIQADVVSHVQRLLEKCRAWKSKGRKKRKR